MTFSWISSIRCEIKYGKAFLYQNNSEEKEKCNGDCSNCDAFLGVDISQIGSPYLDGSCSKVNEKYIH